MRKFSRNPIIYGKYVRMFFNERTFRENRSGSPLDNAKTALLQYNIMIDRGIVPDALTYTSLIQTMANAKLEWQAYKLFSSMIDQGVEPLPETLIALRNATRPTRRRLLEDITDRIEGAVQYSPATLSKEINEILVAGEASEKERIEHFFEASDLALEVQQPSEVDPLDETMVFEDKADTSQPTVSIEHPLHSWNVFKKMSDEKSIPVKAEGNEKDILRSRLLNLHREELNIFCTIHKLLRNGSSEEIVERILLNVPAVSISAMLQRRHKYFRAVESVTKKLLDNADAIAEDDQRRIERGESTEEIVASEFAPHASEEDAHHEGDMLYTPWGAIRKPLGATRQPLKPLVSKNMSEAGFEEVVLRVSSGDVDQVPDAILREYAAHYSLRWKRGFPDSLARAVEWHVEHVLPSLLSAKRTPPTLAMKLRRQELEGAERTLENYEAMRIIAKHTKNLQVTDGVNEINTSIDRANASQAHTEAKNAMRARQINNLKEAEELKRSATQFTPADDRLDFQKVLDEKHKELMSRSSQVMFGDDVPVVGKSPAAGADTQRLEKVGWTRSRQNKEQIESLFDNSTSELPPWELSSASQPFNVDTGRFGDPTMGRYMELSDGRIRLMPQHESLKAHHSQAALLPDQDRAALLKHKAHSKELYERDKADLERKEGIQSFQRFKKYVDRVSLRKLHKQEQKSQPILKEPRRMRDYLKQGHDKASISSQHFKRFTRPQ